MGEIPFGAGSVASSPPLASSTLTDRSLESGLPAIARGRNPVRRLTSKQNRSTIGVNSGLVQATLVPDWNVNSPPPRSRRAGIGMTG